MKQYNMLFFFLFGGMVAVHAQHHKLDHYSIAVTTLHANLPFGSFSSLFVKEFHPGIEAGTGFTWSEKPKHAWFQEFRLGYAYQRWIQHSISLYTAAGYRYKIAKGFRADISIGAGYLHTIPDSKVFKLGSDGVYKKQNNLGRPQVMAVLGIGIGKSFSSGKAIFLNYQQRIQTPFIRSYVPILPCNMLQLGITIPFDKKIINKN